MAILHCVPRYAFLAPPCALPASPAKRLASSSSLGVASPRRIAISCSQAAEPSDAQAAVSCSRREVLSMGGVLAMGLNGLHAMVNPLKAEAEQATCGKYNTTASGLAYCDSQVGSGIAAAKGMLIKAHYSGRLENGSEFDSSYKRRKPLTFRVGVGEVIRGWDQGILGTEGIPAMQAGGKRTLRIPANLGYGERGAGCRLVRWKGLRRPPGRGTTFVADILQRSTCIPLHIVGLTNLGLRFTDASANQTIEIETSLE